MDKRIVLGVASWLTFVAGTASGAPFRGPDKPSYLPAIILLLLDDDSGSTTSNHAPIANAGEGAVIGLGEHILDASNSGDVDGDALTYHWDLTIRPDGSSASLSASNTINPSFDPDVLGRYTAELMVNDGRGGTHQASVSYVYFPCAFEPQYYELDSQNLPASSEVVAQYIPSHDSFIGQAIGLDLVSETKVEAFMTDFDGNSQGDLVLRMPTSNQIQVWLSDAAGVFSTATEYSMGANPLTALVVGDFIAGGFKDIAVADSSGQVGFFEGLSGGVFSYRDSLSFTEADEVVRLASIDLGNEGGDGLLVSTASNVSMHQYDNQLTETDLVRNGAFSQGLSFWQTQTVGNAQNQLGGMVSLSNGVVSLSENQSFRTTLQQSFIVPSVPSTLTFNLPTINLDNSQNGISDAFEVSLLDSNSVSVVSTIDSDATSFLNINPNGAEVLATGVTRQGTQISVDISAVAPTNLVTLYFDLIGNPPGSSSEVSIDNVYAGTVQKENVEVTSFNLSGAFDDLVGMGSCDVDGDRSMEIIVRDEGTSQVLVYSQGQNGQFSLERSISLEGIGGQSND